MEHRKCLECGDHLKGRIDKNMNIFDAATKFISSKRRRFPIVENGKLIGQISQKDILKAAIKVKGNNWK